VTKSSYAREREALIPVAEAIANEVIDQVPLAYSDRWLNLWNKIFHNSVNTLAIHKGLIKGGDEEDGE